MDQTTAIGLGVALAVALVMFVAVVLFAWRSMSQLGKRRFALGGVLPGALPVPQSQPQPSRGCECPPMRGRECVPARVGDPEDVPHAIYGLADGDCCRGGGKVSRRQVQLLVDELNKATDAEDRKKLFERLSGVINNAG